MSFLKKHTHIIVSIMAVLAAVPMYIPLSHKTFAWSGIVLFAFYIIIVGRLWQYIFERVFGMNRRNVVSVVYGYFSVILLLGFFSSVAVVWYKLTPTVLWSVYALVALASVGLLHATRRAKSKKIKVSSSHRPAFGKSALPILIYVFGWAYSLYLLFGAAGQVVAGDALGSPWAAAPGSFLIIYFLLTLIVGALIFSRHNSAVVLAMLVAHGFLLHAFLPAVHTLPFGGDVWRITAAEQQLADGEAILPVLFGAGMQTREFFGMPIPEAFLIPHKYTYGHLWGTTVLIVQTLHINLLTLNKWLVPILWSLAFPIILYRLGCTLFRSRRTALLLVWFSVVPFSFQALGSLTLPVSLGYLTFFFVLSLWTEYMARRNAWQCKIALMFAALMLFGYALHALLMWFVICCFYIFGFLRKRTLFAFKFKHERFRQAIRLALIIFSAAFIPVVELFIVSGTRVSSDIFLNITQLGGSLSGWFYAIAIRPHDIIVGNILFNHTPIAAFYGSLFTAWRYHVLMLSILAWLFVVFTWIRVGMYSKKTISNVYSALFSVGVGGYVIGWVFFQGDHLFIRRLDGLLAFIIILSVVYGISELKQYVKKYTMPGTVLICLFILSWFGATTFASGPDMRALGNNEYAAAKYIYEEIVVAQAAAKDARALEVAAPCILADTWILLGLEQISSGKIVGGGFPIDYNFAQPDRVSLLDLFPQDPQAALGQISGLFSHNSCFVVKEGLTEEKKSEISDFVGQEPKIFGDVAVWELNLKKDLK